MSALKKYNDINQKADALSSVIVDAILEVHKTIGPGFLEKIYEDCLVCELKNRGLKVDQQKPLKINYKDFDIKTTYYLDLVVEDSIIIELKCVEKLLPIHQAQIMSYLKMADIELGFLMNFNSVLMKDGLKRVVLKKTS
jgi:GxxExxY protein